MDHFVTTKNARRISPSGVSHLGKNTSKNLLNLQLAFYAMGVGRARHALMATAINSAALRARAVR